MTPRKEIYIAIRTALKAGISALELIDLKRNKKKHSDYFTAAFISIKNIVWQGMVEQRQEGTCSIEITLYCKDGFADQHDDTDDPNNGLTEIELIDSIVETLQGLYSDNFTPLQLINESDNEDEDEITSYTLTFDTIIYRLINPKHTVQQVSITPPNAIPQSGSVQIKIIGTNISTL